MAQNPNTDASEPAHIGVEIQRLREARGWTLDELAGRVNASAIHLDRLERGWALPRPVLLARLSRALDASPERFAAVEDGINAADLRLVQRLIALGISDPLIEEILTLSAPTRGALGQALGNR